MVGKRCCRCQQRQAQTVYTEDGWVCAECWTPSDAQPAWYEPERVRRKSKQRSMDEDD